MTLTVSWHGACIAIMEDKTLEIRRVPQRPANGLLAWQSTVGYISVEHSPDAALMLRALPKADGIRWHATISYGGTTAQVADADTLPKALRDLWIELERVHDIFKTMQDRVRQPALYADNQWIDSDTAATLASLLNVTEAVFGKQWALILVYQAVENPAQRVKARLVAKDNTVQISGSGPSLREACRDLYRNAAPGYFASSGRNIDSLLT